MQHFPNSTQEVGFKIDFKAGSETLDLRFSFEALESLDNL